MKEEKRNKKKMYLLITNNQKAAESYENHAYIGVEYMKDDGYLDVLIRVRDRVHTGWHLLSHPQASNLKPGQCPYKTILVSRGRSAESLERDIALIESSIAAYHKFTTGMKPSAWNEKALGDFQIVDLSVVESAINSSLMKQMMFGNI